MLAIYADKLGSSRRTLTKAAKPGVTSVKAENFRDILGDWSDIGGHLFFVALSSSTTICAGIMRSAPYQL